MKVFNTVYWMQKENNIKCGKDIWHHLADKDICLHKRTIFFLSGRPVCPVSHFVAQPEGNSDAFAQ